MENVLQEWIALHKFYKSSDYLTKELAGYLNVSPRTIQRWIKGKNQISQAKIVKIEAYLKQKKTRHNP